MTRDELEYQGAYTRERMDEIKNEIKDDYISIRDFDDPMDHYVGYDSTNDTIDNWIEEKAEEYGVSYELIAEVCNEIDRDEMNNAVKEWEWANTPGNLTPEEYDAYMMGELDISDRITSGCHGKSKKDKKKKKAVKSGADYSGENKAKMLAKMANEMSYSNSPEYKRFMNNFDNKVGPYKALLELTQRDNIVEFMVDTLNYSYSSFKNWVEYELEKICEWEYDRDFVYRLKRYAPKAWEDIVEKSAQLVKDNLTSVNSSRRIKSGYIAVLYDNEGRECCMRDYFVTDENGGASPWGQDAKIFETYDEANSAAQRARSFRQGIRIREVNSSRKIKSSLDGTYHHMTVGELKATLAGYNDNEEVRMYVFTAHNALMAGCKAYGYLESTGSESGLVKLYAYEKN